MCSLPARRWHLRTIRQFCCRAGRRVSINAVKGNVQCAVGKESTFSWRLAPRESLGRFIVINQVGGHSLRLDELRSILHRGRSNYTSVGGYSKCSIGVSINFFSFEVIIGLR